MSDTALTSLYAPQVRLVDLATGRIIGATQGNGSSTAIAPDVVSAKVTLTNTGVGQVQVTLNNQRFVQHVNQPPVWKYNGFRKREDRTQPVSEGLGDIGFGQLIRVDFRYGAGTWIKMIVAQVNDLQFSFPASGGAQVQVIGEDILCRFKVKPTADIPYDRKQEEEMVQGSIDKVFEGSSDKPALSLMSDAAQQEGRTQPVRSAKHAKGTTYLQFVTDLAERLDYELFVEFKDLRAQATRTASADAGTGAITLASELEVAFKRCRARTAPTSTKRTSTDLTGEDELPDLHYELRWGRNLIEFSPKFKVFELPTKAEAMGTQPGQRARSHQQLTEAELTALMTAELPASSNYSVAMRNALEARKDYFDDVGAGGESGDSAPGSGLDAPRLKIKAGAQFLKKVREFMTADGQTIGLPRMRPGHYVDIVGLRPPFDGYYYVTKTVHSLDASGYKTQFSVRRPGMQPPEAYLSAATAPTNRGAA